MPAILVVGLSPLTKVATADENQASTQSAQGQLPSGTYWYNQGIVFGNNTDTFKLTSYENNGHEAIKFVNSTNAPWGSEVTFPRTIAQDLDTANAPFIDMDQVKAETTALSGTLSAHEDAGATYDFADQNKKTITNTKGRGCGTFIGDDINVKKVWNDENDVGGLCPASVKAELCYVNEAGETPQALKDSQVQKGPAAGPFVYAFRPVAKLWAFRNSPETWLGHTGT